MPLKLLIWNLQDLFIFIDKYQGEDISSINEAKWQQLSTSLKDNKPIEKLRFMAKTIKTLDPDICLFTEVGGEESLNNLNQFFLDNSFSVLHAATNSDRGIDMGVMIKPNLKPLTRFKMHNHKVFARGVMQVEIKFKNRDSCIFLLTHLKSKLNKKGDFEGREQRKKEVSKLIEIYDKVSNHHQTPCFITGDLNGIIHKDDTEPELALFANKMGLEDALEVLNRSHFERCTYLYYNNHGHENMMQLDYFLLHKNWNHLLDHRSGVVDFDGSKRTSLVGSKAMKNKYPSDHYPLLIHLELS